MGKIASIKFDGIPSFCRSGYTSQKMLSTVGAVAFTVNRVVVEASMVEFALAAKRKNYVLSS
jgi:hypothetical protein